MATGQVTDTPQHDRSTTGNKCLGVAVHTCNQPQHSGGGGRRAKFEVNLGYVASSKPDGAIGDPALKLNS